MLSTATDTANPQTKKELTRVLSRKQGYVRSKAAEEEKGDVTQLIHAFDRACCRQIQTWLIHNQEES